MFGWRSSRPAEPIPYRHLQPGRLHHVVRAFVDHDGIAHPVGERWRFDRASFLPHEDGVVLHVVPPEGGAGTIRFQDRPDAEQRVLQSLFEHVLPLPEHPGAWPLLVTRDSVCMADDIHAPHAGVVTVAPDADAAVVAGAILDASLAWVGGKAAWSFALGSDAVLFGYRHGLRFVWRVGPEPLTARACEVTRLHVTYLAQADARELLAAMQRDPVHRTHDG